ncbi:uncharacterized protein LOC106060948 isoform X2 [Biomphalaria glabrata]|uniref:Uncharacterized protein LOC106060948 isoform X2 n=1 Tax=Biomphalaria glabrata TaxID=6526 RepID=A0A9W3AHY4_BIOGL|nr:uncharacterized protein LOC106060948 isoform X2 [Biomphalaria glabrata]
MDTLLQNPVFRAKMKSLSPATRRWFIDSLIDLFDQESEYVIDVIEDCREEMRETADKFKDEAEQLRTASRLLQEKRESPEQSPKRSVSRVSAPSRLIYVKERQGNGTPDSVLSMRLRQRRRRIVMSDEDGCSRSSPEANDNNRCASSLSVPSLPLLGRGVSPSARTTRSLPVTPTVPVREQDEVERQKKVHEETRAILQNMTSRESQAEVERERQQERLERLRRQKKFLAEDRTQKALQLLEKALEMDKVLVQDKERQGLQLRNKLDEMKKKRGQQNVEYVEVIPLQDK